MITMRKHSLRILFITLDDVSHHKGSSTHIREKVGAFRRRGHRVLLLGGSSNNPDLEDFKSIGSFKRQDGGIGYFALLAVFVRLILQVLKKAKHADVIYVREPLAAFAVVIVKLFHRKKIIFEVNSLDNEEIRMKGDGFAVGLASNIMSLLQHVAAKFSDRIIVITDRVREYYEDNYNIPGDRFTVLGVTTDLDKFHPADNPDRVRQCRSRLNTPDDACVVTFIGNMSHWQDFQMLIKSVKIMNQKNRRIRFLIIGEGSQKDWLEQTLAQEDITDRVLVVGSIPHSEIADYINMSDICISLCKELVSGYSPMKLYEYFACGKPVVATRVSGYEIVERINAGRLIEANDAQGFSEAILSLAENTELRTEYGGNALRFARENLGWDKVISKLESVIEEVVPHAAGSPAE